MNRNMDIENLKQKYHGKTLTSDQYARARNAVDKAQKELEEIEFQVENSDDYILFKWGTLKGWNLTSDKGKELLEAYFALGTSTQGVMTQHDTDEQKRLICEMIDECKGVLKSDWTGEYFTKAQAKKYVMEYGKD